MPEDVAQSTEQEVEERKLTPLELRTRYLENLRQHQTDTAAVNSALAEEKIQEAEIRRVDTEIAYEQSALRLLAEANGEPAPVFEYEPNVGPTSRAEVEALRAQSSESSDGDETVQVANTGNDQSGPKVVEVENPSTPSLPTPPALPTFSSDSKSDKSDEDEDK